MPYYTDDEKRVIGFVYENCVDHDAQSDASSDGHKCVTDINYQEKKL